MISLPGGAASMRAFSTSRSARGGWSGPPKCSSVAGRTASAIAGAASGIAVGPLSSHMSMSVRDERTPSESILAPVSMDFQFEGLMTSGEPGRDA